MRKFKFSYFLRLVFVFLVVATNANAQCPIVPTSDVIDHTVPLCEGDVLTMVATGEGFPVGSTLDWYLVQGTEDPYSGDGELIASAPVTGDPCNNPPEILYVMVNPDNGQVGSSGDQCDEFIVMWTGSGGYNTSDIVITNLGPGSFQWDDYEAGNSANFSCGTALPPGEVPEDAILIIQSSPNNNVFIDIDDLCASGLPVYIIAYTGTVSCVGGYFDNNSPCSSCPVMVDIDGFECQFNFNLDYNPPGSSIDGWGWANTGSGVYADVVPILDIPVFVPEDQVIDDVMWTIPDNFCEDYTGGNWMIVGIPNPPPVSPCIQVTTPYFGFGVGCGNIALAGGGDVCEGNCPDMPTLISFTVEGTDFPFIVDLEVMVPIFGIFPIDDLEISSGQSIQVCLEGLFPSFDPISGILNVPTLAIGFSSSVTIVSATTASGCPVTFNQNSIDLHFIAAPTASTGPDQTICAGETVNITGNIGGSAVSSMWMTNGDGVFEDPNALNTVYTPGVGDIANGAVEITITSVDANGSCIPAESSFTIFINASLAIDLNSPLTICDNDIAFVIAMVTGSNEDCLWETDGDGVFDDPSAESTIYTPGFLDILAGSVTLYYNPVDADACVVSNEPLILTLVPAPDVTLPQGLEVCDGDDVNIEIDVTGDFSNITWSAPGDGVLVELDDFNVIYTPGPMDIANQFFVVSVIIESAYAECGVTTYNIPVNVAFCDCPDFETIPPSLPLCALNDALDLDDLLISGDAGVWSITGSPPGSNPAMLNGTIFTTNISDPGTYTVTYTLNSPEPGCPATSSEMITVHGMLTVSVGNDMAFCGYQNIQLTGMVVPASPFPVSWETLGDGMFTDVDLLSTTYILGAQDSLTNSVTVVMHVVDPVCGNVSDSVTMFFNQPPVTIFVNDTVTVCNSSLNGSLINFNLLITGGDNMGTWSNPFGVPIDFSNLAAVDFDGVAEGYYMFQYETNSALSPCSETVYTIIIDVDECLCPLLTIQNIPDGLCTSQPSLPLDAFIQAGGPGTWAIISTPPGSNPATLNGSILIIDGCDPGTYSFRFTFDAAPIVGCPDSAEVDIFLQGVPLVSLSNDTSFCGVGDLSIEAFVAGSSTGVLWTTSGTGIFNDPSSLTPIYTVSANDVSGGSIYLIGTSVDTFGYCPIPQDSILVTIETPPFTDFSALTDTLCNHPDSGSVINLSAFITGGDMDGNWTDLDNAMVDLNNPSQVDFQTIAAGNYRFSYSTQSAVAPCVDSTYVFTVVVEDCSCPLIDITTDVIMLCVGDGFELADLVNAAAPGTWEVSSGPSGLWPDITGSSMTTSNAMEGSYVITYMLLDSIPSCPASVNISMILEALPVYTITDISCDADHSFYDVIIETNAVTIDADFGVVKIIGSDGFRIDSIPTEQDVIITIHSFLGMCSTTFTVTAPNCDCTLFIEDIADTIRFCPGDMFVLIPFITGAQGLPFSTWITPSETIMWPSLTLTEEGEYIWIVRDEAGCEERDTFHVQFMGPEGIELSSISPSCPDSPDGQIIIESVVGGSPPFIGQLDNTGLPFMIDQLPYTIEQVSIGDHFVIITDIIGCAVAVFVEVSIQSFDSISLGPDLDVLKGDSVLINLNATDVAVASVVWDPDMPGQAFESFWFTPNATTTITAFVTDTAGCVYEDQVLITVYEEENFYIPNVFSPNDDGINDVFEVITNLPETSLVSLEIYDRWGNMVYGQYDTAPFQWDGTFDSQRVQSGVYVYKFSWIDGSGDTLVEAGDITVLR